MPLSVWRDRRGIERIGRARAAAGAGSSGGPDHDRRTVVPTGGTLLASSIDALSAGRDEGSEEFPFHSEQWFGRDTFAGGADEVSRFVVCATLVRELALAHDGFGQETVGATALALDATALIGVIVGAPQPLSSREWHGPDTGNKYS